MKYIYDIALNFNQDYYDFYEWSGEDKILNVKKIPLYRVSKEDYLSLKYNNVIINNIKHKMILITNTLEVMGIILNKDGKLVKRSSLLLDEQDDILDSSEDLKITKIIFKKNIYKRREIIGRNIKEKKKYITSFFNKLNKEHNIYLLKYVYYDLYKKEADINKIYKTLINSDINILYNELKKIKIK